jgi:hypothetical protein
LSCISQEPVDVVANATVECLLRVVPAAVRGIAFLSGGQSGELAPSTKIPWMILAKGRWHSSLFVVAIMPVQGGTFVPADGMKNQDRNVSWFLTMAKE